MHNEADVRLVDTHPECDRRGDHAHVVAQKCFLMSRPLGRGEPGMVCFCAYAVLVQISRQRFGALPACTVNDAAVVRPTAHEGQQLVVGRLFRNYAISQVRPVEAGHVTAWIAQVQFLNDVGPYLFCCRGGERHDGHIGQMFSQLFQLTIFRPEIVTPFADAVRFVDCKLRNIPVESAFQKRVQHQPLRCDVEQSILAAMQAAPARLCFFSINR